MELADKVILTEWRPDWVADSALLADALSAALGPIALRIDHIGSTSVPGLAAKDVIDMQVIVANLDRDAIIETFTSAKFVQKYEEWNLHDHIPAGWVGDVEQWAKLVFATPPGFRLGNVHVRVSGSPNERYALLFRDFLTADPGAREAWGRFKRELAATTQTLADYGSVKDPATDVLMALAERWAADTSWTVPKL
jgi:dephospho-CoA kinase